MSLNHSTGDNPIQFLELEEKSLTDVEKYETVISLSPLKTEILSLSEPAKIIVPESENLFQAHESPDLFEYTKETVRNECSADELNEPSPSPIHVDNSNEIDENVCNPNKNDDIEADSVDSSNGENANEPSRLRNVDTSGQPSNYFEDSNVVENRQKTMLKNNVLKEIVLQPDRTNRIKQLTVDDLIQLDQQQAESIENLFKEIHEIRWVKFYLML